MAIHGDSTDITALRVYKLILTSIARVAGLKSPEACIVAFPKHIEYLDRKSSEFCPGDGAELISDGILKTKEGLEGPDCVVISKREWPNLHVATTIP